MKIALLPLDSRPCNLSFPVQLGEIVNVNIIIPPEDKLDYFMRPADFGEIKKWLLSIVNECDLLICSVDMFLHGGLIASRTENIKLDECMERLKLLKHLKSINPALKIYGYSVMMRTSISTLSEESKIWWEKINLFSQLSYKVEKEGIEEDAQKLNQLVSEIPQNVLETFLSVRKRNHSINMKCVDMTYEEYFDELLLLQEDSTAFGIHKREQEILKKRISRLGLKGKVYMHNGTDEAGALLTTKAINDFMGMDRKIAFKYLTDNRSEFIAMYEDRLFHENLISHAEACGIELNENLKNSKAILFIHGPKKEQFDACLSQGELPECFSASEIDKFSDEIAFYVKAGKRVGLLDIVYANGGDGRLLESLGAKINLGRDLYAYSGWNTASNALGTVISQLLLSSKGDALKNSIFTVERILDDYVYQSVVRKKVEGILKAEGEDVWNLKREKNEADKILFETIHNEAILKQLFMKEMPEFICAFPWPRTFEADIRVIKLTGGGYN